MTIDRVELVTIDEMKAEHVEDMQAPHAALEAYRIAQTGVITSAERAIATARRAIAWVDATRSSSYASPPGPPTRR